MNTSFSKNLRNLRKQKGLTQEALAKALDIKRSIIGAYEEGRAEPSMIRTKEIADYFELSIDLLVGGDLKISKSSHDKMIPLVSQKVAAGYTPGHIDSDFIHQENLIYIPSLSNSSSNLVAFEIAGDSMLPVEEGSIVIVEKIQEISQVTYDKTYVIYTEQDGLVYKRIKKDFEDDSKIIAASDNASYPHYSINKSSILELWRAKYLVSVIQ